MKELTLQCTSLEQSCIHFYSQKGLQIFHPTISTQEIKTKTARNGHKKDNVKKIECIWWSIALIAATKLNFNDLMTVDI